MTLRRGLKADLSRVFDAAAEMTGSMHPDDMDDARAHVEALRKETFTLLRKLKEYARVEPEVKEDAHGFSAWVSCWTFNREAIGHATTREEAAKMAEECAAQFRAKRG